MIVVTLDEFAVDPITNAPFQWDFKANCCYCGDSSFPHIFTGRVRPLGYAEPNPNSPEDVFNKTFIEETDYDEEKVTFKIGREKI